MKLRTLLIGVELSALLSCTTSCILEFPTITNLCDTEWKSESSELGYVELSFKCYDNGKYAFLTQRDGSKLMGKWEDSGSENCSYNIHLTCSNQTNGLEIEIISAEIINYCENDEIMAVSWIYTNSPSMIQTATFTKI